MIDPSEVSAIIPTRGDVDLESIVATLPYDEVIIWNNAEHIENARTFGRYLAIAQAKHDTIYFQDDDLIFTAHEQLCAAHNKEDGLFTSNMPSPWWEEQYERFDMALVGAGSLVPRDLPWAAFGRYLSLWPRDEMFLNYCDMVNGVLTPYRRYDFGYTILPQAGYPNRIHRTPGEANRKQLVIDRALAIRRTT